MFAPLGGFLALNTGNAGFAGILPLSALFGWGKCADYQGKVYFSLQIGLF